MRIAFVHDKVIGTEFMAHWRDGLWRALKILSERHELKMVHPEDVATIEGFKPDVLLFWESLQTQSHKKYDGYAKALCFAGGPIDEDIAQGFDLYFVESRIDHERFSRLNRQVRFAFGVNEDIYKPLAVPKRFSAIYAAAFASWKRQELFAAAAGISGVAVGEQQEVDRESIEVCHKNKNLVLPHLPPSAINVLINSSNVALNTANEWGGGQRFTLEAMACNVPVIVMEDSPKNREYVEESGAGLVCPPGVEAIRETMVRLGETALPSGRKYILSKWTSNHYANALEEGLKEL